MAGNANDELTTQLIAFLNGDQTVSVANLSPNTRAGLMKQLAELLNPIAPGPGHQGNATKTLEEFREFCHLSRSTHPKGITWQTFVLELSRVQTHGPETVTDM